MRKDVLVLIGLDLLARRRRLIEVDDTHVDQLLADAAPDPGLALLEWTAGLDAVVLDVLNRIAGRCATGGVSRREALLTLRVGDVVRLEAVVGDVIAARSVEPVAAALGHEVDADAAGLLRHVDAARVDRHL